MGKDYTEHDSEKTVNFNLKIEKKTKIHLSTLNNNTNTTILQQLNQNLILNPTSSPIVFHSIFLVQEW